MEKTIKVSIERTANMVVVYNDQGKKWYFPYEIPNEEDTSSRAAIAEVASAMLTGTIASQLKNVKATSLSYTLTLETW